MVLGKFVVFLSFLLYKTSRFHFALSVCSVMNNRARQFNVCDTIVCWWCASGFRSYHTWRQHAIYSCFFFFFFYRRNRKKLCKLAIIWWRRKILKYTLVDTAYSRIKRKITKEGNNLYIRSVVISAHEESFVKLHLHHQGFLDEWFQLVPFQYKLLGPVIRRLISAYPSLPRRRF